MPPLTVNASNVTAIDEELNKRMMEWIFVTNCPVSAFSFDIGIVYLILSNSQEIATVKQMSSVATVTNAKMAIGILDLETAAKTATATRLAVITLPVTSLQDIVTANLESLETNVTNVRHINMDSHQMGASHVSAMP